MSSKSRLAQGTAEKSLRTLEFTVDLGRYEVPIVGFADSCVVREFADVVECVFSETHAPKGPVSVARFFLGYHDVAQVWNQSTGFLEALEGMSDRALWGSYPILPALPPDFPEPATPAPLCSMISMAKLGGTALIECFYLTPTSTLRLRTEGKAGKVRVVPLFGVQVPAGLVLSFVSKIKLIAETHPKSPPKS